MPYMEEVLPYSGKLMKHWDKFENFLPDLVDQMDILLPILPDLLEDEEVIELMAPHLHQLIPKFKVILLECSDDIGLG